MPIVGRLISDLGKENNNQKAKVGFADKVSFVFYLLSMYGVHNIYLWLFYLASRTRAISNNCMQ
jgi:hypothetical protein